MGHDGSVVLEWVANVAVVVGIRSRCSVVELILVGRDVAGRPRSTYANVVIPLVAVVLPRNFVGVEVIANAGRRRRWNRKRRVIDEGVREGVAAVAKVARIVVVQQVVVARFAARIDRPGKRLEILQNFFHSGLLGIRTIAVGPAAGNGRTKATAAVAVLGVPVVGAGGRIGVFHFIDDSGIRAARVHRGTFGWLGSLAVGVAEPDGIAVTEHDVIGASAALYGLVEVIAHRVFICQQLEIRGIALLHVVETKGCRAFAGGICLRNVGQIVRGEARGGPVIRSAKRRLSRAVRAGSHGYFHPGEQLAVAAGGIFKARMLHAAVQLLVHLVEAMDGAGGVGVVGELAAVCQLERSGRQG